MSVKASCASGSCPTGTVYAAPNPLKIAAATTATPSPTAAPGSTATPSPSPTRSLNPCSSGNASCCSGGYVGSYSVVVDDGTSPCPYLAQNRGGMYSFSGGSSSLSLSQNTSMGPGSCLLTISTSGQAIPQTVKLYFATTSSLPTTPPGYGGGGGGGGGGNCTTIGVYGGGAGTASGMQACKM